MKTLLIIPAYNEEESLKLTIDSIYAVNAEVDFLVVNDGSKDGTVEVCRENQYPFLDLPTNLGLAGALQAGMKYAYRHGYDCVIQFDADGQHLPEYIKPLEEAVKPSDIAIGSRFVDKKTCFYAHVWQQLNFYCNKNYYRQIFEGPNFWYACIQ